jgi:hypothetical protein
VAVLKVTFDNELTLIDLIYSENEVGDAISSEERLNILCDVASITRSEHYAAASHGIKPEIVFIINQFDFGKQSMVEFEGERYKVIRVYKSKKSSGIEDFDTIELICSGYINDGDYNG